MDQVHERESCLVRVEDGPQVELTGIVVEAMRAASEVALGTHFAEAAFMWNEGIDSLDIDSVRTFRDRLSQSLAYVETLVMLAPVPFIDED